MSRRPIRRSTFRNTIVDKGRFRTTARKAVGPAIGQALRVPQDVDVARREWHTARTAGLYPAAGHRSGSGQHFRHRHPPARRAPARPVHLSVMQSDLK